MSFSVVLLGVVWFPNLFDIFYGLFGWLFCYYHCCVKKAIRTIGSGGLSALFEKF